MTVVEESLEGFKETEIGLLPEDWGELKLNDAAILIMGQSPKGESYNEIGNGLPLINGPAEFGKKYPKIFKWTSKPTKVCEKGDILFCVRGNTTGRMNLSDSRYCIGRGVAAIRGKSQYSATMYVSYFLQKEAPNILSMAFSGGSTFPNITKFQLERLKIPFPHFSEQQKIASVLSAVQEAKEKTEGVIKATKEFKKSMMKHLFTYGPVPIEEAGKGPLKETEIGLIPEHWEVKQLGEIATLQRGKDLPKQNQILGEYPVVGAGGVIASHNQFTCEGPGVVTGRSGSIGNLIYVEGRYWGHNTGLYVKDFHGNYEKFVYFLMHKLDFKKYATGVSVPTLNRNFIHIELLPLPPLNEQKQIAEILSAIDAKIAAEENKKNALESLFKTLLSLLMTGKIRVKDLEV